MFTFVLHVIELICLAASGWIYRNSRQAVDRCPSQHIGQLEQLGRLLKMTRQSVKEIEEREANGTISVKLSAKWLSSGHEVGLWVCT